jgi:hypothetical protein
MTPTHGSLAILRFFLPSPFVGRYQVEAKGSSCAIMKALTGPLRRQD